MSAQAPIINEFNLGPISCHSFNQDRTGKNGLFMLHLEQYAFRLAEHDLNDI
jgi:hypothetical protein